MKNRRQQTRVGKGFQAEIPNMLSDNDINEERKRYDNIRINVKHCFYMNELSGNMESGIMDKPVHNNLLMLCEHNMHPNCNYYRIRNRYRRHYNQYKSLKLEDFQVNPHGRLKSRSLSVMSSYSNKWYTIVYTFQFYPINMIDFDILAFLGAVIVINIKVKVIVK